MCDLMTQGVLVKPWQDFRGLKVLWDSTLVFIMTDKIDLSFFLF